MSTEPRKPTDATDPKTWPVVECEPTDVFLGAFTHDCTPNLTDEQKSWPVVECEPTDVFLDPSLVVDLTPRPDAERTEIVHGTAEFLRALSAHEEKLGGSGLILDTRRHPSPAGTVRLVLYPKTEPGAKERLRQVAELVPQAANVGPCGSFVGCHVAVA